MGECVGGAAAPPTHSPISSNLLAGRENEKALSIMSRARAPEKLYGKIENNVV